MAETTNNKVEKETKNTPTAKEQKEEQQHIDKVEDVTHDELLEEDGAEKSPTMDELMAQIAEYKVKADKTKKALDEALSKNGQLTKKLREKMTITEQEAIAEQEAREAQEAELNELRNFKKLTEARDRYLMQMDSDTAMKAATAEVEGDMELLSTITKQFYDAKAKNDKQRWEEEWLASRPEIQTGSGQLDEDEDPFLAGFDSNKSMFVNSRR